MWRYLTSICPRSTASPLRERSRRRASLSSVIFLTIHYEEDFFRAALDLGVRGYVLKDSAATDIVASIKAVAAGRHYTSPALTSSLVKRARRGSDALAEKPTLSDLTQTERRILQLIAGYKTNKEIADELCISFGRSRHIGRTCAPSSRSVAATP